MILSSRHARSPSRPLGISIFAPESGLACCSSFARSSRRPARCCLPASASPSSTTWLSRVSGSFELGAGFLGVPAICRTLSAFHLCSCGSLLIVRHLNASPFALTTMCSPLRGIWPTHMHSMHRHAIFLFCFFFFPRCCLCSAIFARIISPNSTNGLFHFLLVSLSYGVMPSFPTLKWFSRNVACSSAHWNTAEPSTNVTPSLASRPMTIALIWAVTSCTAFSQGPLL